MVGLNAPQFARYVVRFSLNYLGWGGSSAERLVLGTALTESGLVYLKQIGDGPARGVFQMEPATHQDIWDNWLRYKPEGQLIERLRAPGMSIVDNLYGNMYYAAAMCRAHYRRQPGVLPDADDPMAMAHYWKEYYNTHLGAGDPHEAVDHFTRAIIVFEDL